MLVPEIIPATILTVDQAVAEDSDLADQTLEAVGAVLPQEIIPGVIPSAVIGFKNLPVINREDASGTHPLDVIGFYRTSGATTTVQTGTGSSAPPIRIWSQNIDSPGRPIAPQEARNAEPFDASINGFSTENRNSSGICSKVVGGKETATEGTNIYASRQVNFGSNSILT